MNQFTAVVDDDFGSATLCGLRPSVLEFNYPVTLKQQTWNAVEVLNAAENQTPFNREIAVTSSMRHIILADLLAEQHADYLCQYLSSARDRGELVLPAAFWNFEKAWREDELNHYRGFRALYLKLFEESDKELDEIVKKDCLDVDFTSIARFLIDPYQLLLSIAYDEAVTVIGYAKDRDAYEQIGGQALRTWASKIIKDEQFHASNAVALLKHLYPDRLEDLEKDLSERVEHDKKGVNYRNTFLFFHPKEQYKDQDFEDAANFVMRLTT